MKGSEKKSTADNGDGSRHNPVRSKDEILQLTMHRKSSMYNEWHPRIDIQKRQNKSQLPVNPYSFRQPSCYKNSN